MAKKKSGQTSVRKRREEMQQKKAEAAKQKRMAAGILVALALIILFWLMRGLFLPETESEPIILEGERPLAALAPQEREDFYSSPPEMTIDTSKEYEAIITMENGSEMRIKLFDDESPITVNNFVFLANQGFYDGIIFHRVMSGFMAQGGDPTGSGRGGPGYRFEDEFDNGLVFDKRGLLAMANSGANTNGSQFFITFEVESTAQLTGRHTIFGELVEGDDALSNITIVNPGQPGDVIETIKIEVK